MLPDLYSKKANYMKAYLGLVTAALLLAVFSSTQASAQSTFAVYNLSTKEVDWNNESGPWIEESYRTKNYIILEYTGLPGEGALTLVNFRWIGFGKVDGKKVYCHDDSGPNEPFVSSLEFRSTGDGKSVLLAGSYSESPNESETMILRGSPRKGIIKKLQGTYVEVTDGYMSTWGLKLKYNKKLTQDVNQPAVTSFAMAITKVTDDLIEKGYNYDCGD
jgi:hypothetical protein